MLDETKTLKKLASLKAKQLGLIPKIQKESKAIDIFAVFRLRNMCDNYINLETQSQILSSVITES